MSVYALRDAQKARNFHRNSFRRAITFLLISVCLNGLMALIIYYRLIHKGEETFYATSGVKAPIKLTPLTEPNKSSKPLLPADPKPTAEERLINRANF